MIQQVREDRRQVISWVWFWNRNCFECVCSHRLFFKIQISKFWNEIPYKMNLIRNRESLMREQKRCKKLWKVLKSNRSRINKSIRKIQFFHKLFFNEMFDGGTALERHPSAQSSCCAHTTCLILFSSSSSIEALMSSFISKWLFLFWIVKLLSLTLLTWGNNREKRRYFLSGLIFVAKFCHFFSNSY